MGAGSVLRWKNKGLCLILGLSVSVIREKADIVGFLVLFVENGFREQNVFFMRNQVARPFVHSRSLLVFCVYCPALATHTQCTIQLLSVAFALLPSLLFTLTLSRLLVQLIHPV